MADMLIAGTWRRGDRRAVIRSPFDGSPVDSVPIAGAAEVEEALVAAESGAAAMRKTSGHDRGKMLHEAAARLRQRGEDFARTISREEGKTLAESRAEVGRAAETLELSGSEAKRLAGRGIPLQGAPDAGDRIGFTVREPCGIVVAISPFNFPLNLVTHKVGPALAGGNAVIMKPASATPLSALMLAEVLLQVGFPGEAIQCLPGPGGELGELLCRDPRVRKISFTGSVPVGEAIVKAAGVKRVTLELGGNSPLIVMEDADLEKVAKATVVTGYGNAGQVCISTQRVLAHRKVVGDLLAALKPAVAGIKHGDPLAADTKMGPMTSAKEAARVKEWLDEAKAGGATLATGGDIEGALLAPALVVDPPAGSKLLTEEVFGPAVSVLAYDDIEAAIAAANDTRFGLAAGIFTRDVGRALAFIKGVRAGNLHVNWGPGWRADLMPYGGLKDSGIGKEGPADAILEMTEEKTVIFHP